MKVKVDRKDLLNKWAGQVAIGNYHLYSPFHLDSYCESRKPESLHSIDKLESYIIFDEEKKAATSCLRTLKIFSLDVVPDTRGVCVFGWACW